MWFAALTWDFKWWTSSLAFCFSALMILFAFLAISALAAATAFASLTFWIFSFASSSECCLFAFALAFYTEEAILAFSALALASLACADASSLSAWCSATSAVFVSAWTFFFNLDLRLYSSFKSEDLRWAIFALFSFLSLLRVSSAIVSSWWTALVSFAFSAASLCSSSLSSCSAF